MKLKYNNYILFIKFTMPNSQYIVKESFHQYNVCFTRTLNLYILATARSLYASISL